MGKQCKKANPWHIVFCFFLFATINSEMAARHFFFHHICLANDKEKMKLQPEFAYQNVRNFVDLQLPRTCKLVNVKDDMKLKIKPYETKK